MADFTEQRFDYTGGRKDAPMLTIMVGVSGSGKSVISKQWVNWGQGNIVRLNRDTLRAMLYMDVPWSSKLENLTRGVEKEAARMALQMGKEVIIDDTNCNRNVRYDWEKMAQQMRCRFRIVTMTTDLKVCIERDSKREGKERVGEGVIRKQWKDLNEVKVTVKKEAEPAKMTRPYFNRQQLQQGGFLPRLPGCPWVLVDVDGTVADSTGMRSPYDESRVLNDKVYEDMATKVRQMALTHNVCVVSGRKDVCGDDTWDWFELNNIPFDHMIMRYSGDNRPDTIVKQEICDEIVAVVGRENIALVIDDRPKVIRMWRSNGIKVLAARGEADHKAGCEYDPNIPGAKEFKGNCPDCGAMEDF